MIKERIPKLQSLSPADFWLSNSGTSYLPIPTDFLSPKSSRTNSIGVLMNIGMIRIRSSSGKKAKQRSFPIGVNGGPFWSLWNGTFKGCLGWQSDDCSPDLFLGGIQRISVGILGEYIRQFMKRFENIPASLRNTPKALKASRQILGRGISKQRYAHNGAVKMAQNLSDPDAGAETHQR
jgi:hypothetical protein